MKKKRFILGFPSCLLWANKSFRAVQRENCNFVKTARSPLKQRFLLEQKVMFTLIEKPEVPLGARESRISALYACQISYK